MTTGGAVQQNKPAIVIFYTLLLSLSTDQQTFHYLIKICVFVCALGQFGAGGVSGGLTGPPGPPGPPGRPGK